MKRKKRKIKKIIVYIFLITIICLVIMIYSYSKYRNKLVGRGDYNLQDESLNEKYLEERVLPRNIIILNKYNGNVKKDKLYIKLQEVVNLFIDINNTEDEMLEKYFSDNKDLLNNYFDEIDFEEFKKLANKISFEQTQEFKYAEVLENFKALEEHHIFYIELNYSNNKKITLETYIKNRGYNHSSDIKFKCID